VFGSSVFDRPGVLKPTLRSGVRGSNELATAGGWDLE
jgi:hypothetical protein